MKQPHLFQPEIAEVYGTDSAIFIQYVAYCIDVNKDNGRNFYEGRYWTYNSYPAFARTYSYWSIKTIRRIIGNLVKAGALLQRKIDEVDCYAYSLSDELLCFFSHSTNMPLGGAQTGTKGCPNGQEGCPNGQEGCPNGQGDTYINKQLYKQLYNTIVYEPADKSASPLPETEDSSNIVCSCEDVKEETTPEKVTNDRRRRTSERKCLFANSRYFDKEKFFAEFTEADRKAIDINHYYNAVADWSASSGKMKQDWIATARNFIRKDKESGKLHKAVNQYGLTNDDADEVEFFMRDKMKNNGNSRGSY